MHVSTQPDTHSGRVLITKDRILITLLFAVITLLVLAVLWPTSRSMIEIWKQSSAYGHCYLVIPVAVWMAWRESAALASVPLRPFWLGLVVIAATGFVWLLGELASVAALTQFAAIGLVAATVLTVFGRTWARQLAFPLGFLFFAVPFGEGLLPILMEWTADVTVGALRVTGIPVYREGNYFILPSGAWSVVEACSGVRYLIAAFMVGCIFAWLQYRASIKRVVFVCLALAVALVSNWLRAYAIVLMGHVSNNRIGTGDVDHNLFGWLIFGAAMFGLFSIGMRWSDREGDSTSSPAQRSRAQPVSILRDLYRAGGKLADGCCVARRGRSGSSPELTCARSRLKRLPRAAVGKSLQLRPAIGRRNLSPPPQWTFKPLYAMEASSAFILACTAARSRAPSL